MKVVKTTLEEASEFVFDFFKKNLSPKFFYHNYHHTYETVEACRDIAKGYELNENEMENLLLAAWFHDVGYAFQYKGHEQKSVEIALDFLEKLGKSEEQKRKIVACILATNRDSVNNNNELICQILCDADIVQIGQPTFFAKSELLRAEWENFDIRNCSEPEWAKTQLDFLQSTAFQTQHAERLYGLQHSFNILEQKARLKQVEKKQERKKKEEWKSKAEPKRGIETMFRSLYRNHINLSSMADSKANMMINIHSLIISISLTLVGAKFSIFGTSFRQSQIIIVPIISLLLTSLGSIVFAILSAKPKITHRITRADEIKKREASILFFGNYTRISIEDFEKEVRELMKNQDDLYGNMIKDLYYLGRVLRKKYRLLKISYIIFMLGLIITGLTTFVVMFYLKNLGGYYRHT